MGAEATVAMVGIAEVDFTLLKRRGAASLSALRVGDVSRKGVEAPEGADRTPAKKL